MLKTRSPLPLRLQRSQLAVPASSPHFFEKAARCPADAIFLDLEDSVQPHMKEQAREHAVRALNEVDWGNRVMSVRINGLDTQWGWQDIATVATRCPRLDCILLPKANGPADVQFVDILLTAIELGLQRKTPVGIEALIETASGMAHVEQIAACSERLEALIFGVGDFALSMQVADMHTHGGPSAMYQVLTTPGEPGERRSYWGDPWHHALGRVVTAARAYGLRAIDGPFGNVRDDAGYRSSASRGAMLGFEGKWCIHPSQVESANEVHSPTPQALAWAEPILQRLKEAGGAGAALVEGQLIDQAHIKMMEQLMERKRLIGAAVSARRTQ